MDFFPSNNEPVQTCHCFTHFTDCQFWAPWIIFKQMSHTVGSDFIFLNYCQSFAYWSFQKGELEKWQFRVGKEHELLQNHSRRNAGIFLLTCLYLTFCKLQSFQLLAFTVFMLKFSWFIFIVFYQDKKPKMNREGEKTGNSTVIVLIFFLKERWKTINWRNQERIKNKLWEKCWVSFITVLLIRNKVKLLWA